MRRILLILFCLILLVGCSSNQQSAKPKNGVITIPYEKPVDFKQFEVFVSTTPSFRPTGWDGSKWTGQPNAPSEWNGADKTLFMVTTNDPIQVTGLTPGKTYYAQVVVVDKSNQRSIPSPEIEAVAGDAQRSSTLVVAASDASPMSKAGADYICDGASDQVTINEAMESLPVIVKETGISQGSTSADNEIILSATSSSNFGEYVGLNIEITSGTGIGQVRTIYYYNGTDKVAIVSDVWNIKPDATSQYKISGKIGKVILTEGNYNLSEPIIGKHRISINGSGYGKTIVNCPNSAGLYLSHVSYIEIGGIEIRGNKLANCPGIYMVESYQFKISDVKATRCDIGFNIGTCETGLLENCIARENITGFSISDSTVTLQLPISENNENNGIYLGDSPKSIINAPSVSFNGYNGINVYGGCNDAKIDGGYFEGNGIQANNVYSNILIESSGVIVVNNRCLKGLLTNKPKYGIRIESGSLNVVSNNDCYQAGATAGISNAGTNTSFGAGNRNNNGTWSTTPN